MHCRTSHYLNSSQTGIYISVLGLDSFQPDFQWAINHRLRSVCSKFLSLSISVLAVNIISKEVSDDTDESKHNASRGTVAIGKTQARGEVVLRH